MPAQTPWQQVVLACLQFDQYHDQLHKTVKGKTLFIMCAHAYAHDTNASVHLKLCGNESEILMQGIQTLTVIGAELARNDDGAEQLPLCVHG